MRAALGLCEERLETGPAVDLFVAFRLDRFLTSLRRRVARQRDAQMRISGGMGALRHGGRLHVARDGDP